MSGYGLTPQDLGAALAGLAASNKVALSSFGTRYSQRFEAYCYLAVLDKIRRRGVNVNIVNPGGAPIVRLKFSTRGNPHNYSYATFTSSRGALEVRHNLKVHSAHCEPGSRASFCLDIAIVKSGSVPRKGKAFVPNRALVTFFECKAMNVFPELLASFLGIVGEVMPKAYARLRPTWFTRCKVDPPALLAVGPASRVCDDILRTFSQRGLIVRAWTYDHGRKTIQRYEPSRR